MSPGAFQQLAVFNGRDGHQIEGTSDAINTVNVLRVAMKNNSKFDDASEFDTAKDEAKFRQYLDANEQVKNFYREQHEKKTVAYNLRARTNFKTMKRARMTVWEAIGKLNILIDESDPDTNLSQIEHLLQTAEAIRRDGKPRWMQVIGLIHDLGKLLFFFDAEGQWDVVGDTFPVGCAPDQRIIPPETFKNNPDYGHPVYSTEFDIYHERCGLDNIMLSWGYDEYLYRTMSSSISPGFPMRGLP